MCKNLLVGTIEFAALLLHQSYTTPAVKTIITKTEKIENLILQKPPMGWNSYNCFGENVGNQIG